MGKVLVSQLAVLNRTAPAKYALHAPAFGIFHTAFKIAEIDAMFNTGDHIFQLIRAGTKVGVGHAGV
ncbi:MAG TPA: hypothetical protein DDZ65_01510, partial [Firmicutes bacterium]|nr:hypothetical protein [Bacillota bacterium]